MVYKDTPLAEAEERYKKIVLPDLPNVAPEEEIKTTVIAKRKRKVPKAAAPKST